MTCRAHCQYKPLEETPLTQEQKVYELLDEVNAFMQLADAAYHASVDRRAPTVDAQTWNSAVADLQHALDAFKKP